MRDRSDPWKWPVCVGLTFVLLAAVFLLPAGWIHSFFSPLSLLERLQNEQETQWLTILPPPPVELVPDQKTDPTPKDQPPEPPEFYQDPDWWTAGWRVQTVTMESPPGPQGWTAEDSVAVLLTALGVERDFMARARPDSLLASRLFLLQVEDSFRFDELKPYLTAMARARDYADIMSRAADMYDDFLAMEIMTPD